jgi:protein involved in polysaccharide export with SLBB domain
MLLKKLTCFSGSFLISYFILYLSFCFCQQVSSKKDQYIVSEEQKLQIAVHIWGEVNRPGQYIVQDGTNVLELISLAGGPTEFSNLSNIKLTREYVNQKKFNNPNKQVFVKKQLIKIDLKKYLEKNTSQSIPILQPGDVIKINRNLWSKWQTVIRVVSQVAIVIQAMYFYSRIE